MPPPSCVSGLRIKTLAVSGGNYYFNFVILVIRRRKEIKISSKNNFFFNGKPIEYSIKGVNFSVLRGFFS